jgi:hypothetical protein
MTHIKKNPAAGRTADGVGNDAFAESDAVIKSNLVGRPAQLRVKQAILEKVRTDDSVSYIEITELEGCKGHYSVRPADYPNLLYWVGLSREAINAISELKQEGLIEQELCAPMVYFIDGGHLNLPVATRPPPGGYKKPHWVPIVLRPLPRPTPKRRGGVS